VAPRSAIAEATAFVLLIGEKGIGPWQIMEYYEALDRRVKEHDFPVVLVLLDGQQAPGLPFLRQLHWVIAANPAFRKKPLPNDGRGCGCRQLARAIMAAHRTLSGP
jgi:hypothetical protein